MNDITTTANVCQEVKPERVKVERDGQLNSYRLSKLIAYEVRGLGKGRKAVLRAMADHYPNVFPSMERLGLAVGCDASTARRNVRDLEALGVIKPVGGRSRGRKPTQYMLNVPLIMQWAKGRAAPDLRLISEKRNPAISAELEKSNPAILRCQPGYFDRVNPLKIAEEVRSKREGERQDADAYADATNFHHSPAAGHSASGKDVNEAQRAPANKADKPASGSEAEWVEHETKLCKVPDCKNHTIWGKTLCREHIKLGGNIG